MKTKNEKLLYLINQAKEEYSEDYIVIPVPKFISNKFVAYCSMRVDLELILKYIMTLRDGPEREIKSAMAFSIISLYGKCFSDASKNSYPKLESSNLFQEGEDNYKTHKYLIELRHQFIAHRGETDSEIGISYIIIPKSGDLDKTQVRFSHLKLTSLSKTDLTKIEILVKYLIEELKVKIQKTGQKIHSGMLKLFTHEQLNKMLINNMK